MRDQEADCFCACVLNREPDVIIAVATECGAPVIRRVSNIKGLALVGADDAPGGQNLPGGRIDYVDGGIHFALTSTATDPDALDAKTAAGAARVALGMGDGALDQQLCRRHLSGDRRLFTGGCATGRGKVLFIHGRITHVGFAEDNKPAGLVEHVGEDRAPGIANIPIAIPAGPVLKLRNGDRVAEAAGSLFCFRGQHGTNDGDKHHENKRL